MTMRVEVARGWLWLVVVSSQPQVRTKLYYTKSFESSASNRNRQTGFVLGSFHVRVQRCCHFSSAVAVAVAVVTHAMYD